MFYSVKILTNLEKSQIVRPQPNYAFVVYLYSNLKLLDKRIEH